MSCVAQPKRWHAGRLDGLCHTACPCGAHLVPLERPRLRVPLSNGRGGELDDRLQYHGGPQGKAVFQSEKGIDGEEDRKERHCFWKRTARKGSVVEQERQCCRARKAVL